MADLNAYIDAAGTWSNAFWLRAQILAETDPDQVRQDLSTFLEAYPEDAGALEALRGL